MSRLHLLIVLLLGLPVQPFVQARSLVPSFSEGGKLTTLCGAGKDEYSAMATQDDGKIAVKDIAFVNGNYHFSLAPYHTNDRPDLKFDADGKVTTPIGIENSLACAFDIQGSASNMAVRGKALSGKVVAETASCSVFDIDNIAHLPPTAADNPILYSSPSVMINQAASQSDPSSNSPIHFTVTFSEAVTGFTESDISFVGSTGFFFFIPETVITGGPIVYNVAVSGMMSSGTIVAIVPEGVAFSSTNQSNLASTSVDNSITYIIPPCTVTCPSNSTNPATSLSGAVFNYNVTSSGDCRNIVSVPASGTVFPVGTTTVNAYNNVSVGMSYGLLANNELVTFNVNAVNPTFVSSIIPVTGLAFGGVQTIEQTKLVAIDFRPSNGQLYGLVIKQLGTSPNQYVARIFSINKTTGVASEVSHVDIDIMGMEFSIDFNPVTDVLRITSDFGYNLRVDPDLGTLVAADPTLIALNNLSFVGNAHSNNISPATFTTSYLLNDLTNSLYVQGGINGIPSSNTGTTTLVGPLGIDFGSATGFDISLSGGALVSTKVGGAHQLYSISLNTGAATLLGSFNTDVIDIAITPVNLPPPSCSFSATITPLLPPTIACPTTNIIIYAEENRCDASINFAEAGLVTIGGGLNAKISFTSLLASGSGSGGGNLDVLPTIYFNVGVYTVEFTVTNAAGSASCNFTVTVIDGHPPILVCPANKVVNVAEGSCSSLIVPFTIGVTEACYVNVSTSAGVGWGYPGGTNLSLTGGSVFPVGINTVTVIAEDASGNTSTCSFLVTVLDNQIPVITAKPDDVTVSCAALIPIPDNSAVSATDNCGSPTVTHEGDVISNQICANKYLVTRTYKATDGSGNSVTAVQLITVNDLTPPTITGLTPSKRILAPPNHKMVPISLAYTVNDNCSGTPDVTISVTSNEPINGTGDGDTDPDWEIIDDHNIKLRAERSGTGTGRIYTITVTVNDGCNGPVSASTEVRVTHNIKDPNSGRAYLVGSTVPFEGEFWDKPGNSHTAKWLIDGSVAANGIVTTPTPNQNGKVTGSFKFNAPGVYKLQMNVTDQNGVTSFANTNGDVDAIVVIYDPNGGHTYGGGWYASPLGAVRNNLLATGKASYGFAVNYRNAAKPKGETQLEFKVGTFEFNALNFDYLVVAGAKAQFRGTGKVIGGQSGLGFIMTVMDGALDGTGDDKIRMKIYNRNSGAIIYDNQYGDGDAANPTTVVGTNSIIFIQGTPVNTFSRGVMEDLQGAEKLIIEEAVDLDMTAFPNPSSKHFTLKVKTSNSKERLTLEVLDQSGRLIERRSDVRAGQIISIGSQYRPGLYLVRITQGKKHTELKLIKI